MPDMNNKSFVKSPHFTSFFNISGAGVVKTTSVIPKIGNNIESSSISILNTVSNGIVFSKNILNIKNKLVQIPPLTHLHIFSEQIKIEEHTSSIYEVNSLNVKHINPLENNSNINKFFQIETGVSLVKNHFVGENIVSSVGTASVLNLKKIENFSTLILDNSVLESRVEIKNGIGGNGCLFNLNSMLIRQNNNGNLFAIEDSSLFQKNSCIVKASTAPSMNAGGSGGFKELTLYFQKMAYIELDLKFDSDPIIEVQSLPSGLEFKGSKICGSLINSGIYDIVFIFQSGKKINGFIVCPDIERIF